MSMRLIKSQQNVSNTRQVNVYKDSDTGEYVVRLAHVTSMGLKWQDSADYFTDDKDDALGTARVMLQHDVTTGPAFQPVYPARKNPIQNKPPVIRKGYFAWAHGARGNVVKGYIAKVESTGAYAKAYGARVTFESGLTVAKSDIYQTVSPKELRGSQYGEYLTGFGTRTNPAKRATVKRKPAKAKTPEMYKREHRYTLDKKVTGNTWMIKWQSGDKASLMSMARLMHRADKADGKNCVYRVYDHGA